MSVSRSQAVLAAGGLAVLLAAGSLTAVLNRSSPGPAGTGSDRIANAAFAGFTDCAALLNYYRTHGRDLVGPYGLPGTGIAADVLGSAVSRPATVPRALSPQGTARDAAGAASSAGSGSNSGSASGAEASSGTGSGTGTGTNVQVAGIDEADVAKRSGDLLLTVGSPVGRLLYPMMPGGAEIAPQAGVPQAGVPDGAAPGDAAPGDAVPGDAAPGSATLGGAVPGDAAPGSATLGGAVPGSGSAVRQQVGPGLRILRMSGTRATLLGVLPTTGWTAQELLVRDGTALLLGPAPYRPVATPGDGIATVPPFSRPRTRIAQVDIGDPAHPRLIRTLDVDGNLVGARLSADVARLAVTSPPGDLHLATPQLKGTGPAGSPGRSPEATAAPTTEAQSLAENRRRIAASSLNDWLPQYTLVEGSGAAPSASASAGSASASAGSASASAGSRTSSGPMLDCAKVAAPTQFSGLDTLSLLTFDLTGREGIASWDGAGVVTTGATMYATADHTYVATAPWQNWSVLSGDRLRRAEQEQRTWIHEFATSGTAGPRYLASGAVPGFLLNQYALDEYRGDLRVASTVHPTRLGPDQPTSTGAEGPANTAATAPEASSPEASSPTSMPTRVRVDSSQVTVLRREGDRLTEVGSVDGIGKGEQIRGVRFIGSVGYVITFRQTDPLFTINLSDPTRPRVAGELKMLGYSAYLHPAGDGLLLGAGQAADGDGRQQGLQLSLFDVSDPAAPRRLAQVVLPGAVSDVESNAHAFTFSDGLVLLPYSRSTSVPGPRWAPGPTLPDGASTTVLPDNAWNLDAGVAAVRVDGRKLSEPTLLHPLGPSTTTRRSGDYPDRAYLPDGEPLRTFVNGGAIWTVTRDGVATHQESTLRWLAFTTYRR